MSVWFKVNSHENETDIYFGVFNTDPRSIGKILERPKNPFFHFPRLHNSFSDKCCMDTFFSNFYDSSLEE